MCYSCVNGLIVNRLSVVRLEVACTHTLLSGILVPNLVNLNTTEFNMLLPTATLFLLVTGIKK